MLILSNNICKERTAFLLQHSTYCSDLHDSWINLCCAINNTEGHVLLGLGLQTALKNTNKPLLAKLTNKPLLEN